MYCTGGSGQCTVHWACTVQEGVVSVQYTGHVLYRREWSVYSTLGMYCTGGSGMYCTGGSG